MGRVGSDFNEQIIASLTSGVIAVDGDGLILTANEAAGRHLNIAMDVLQPGLPITAMPEADLFVEVMREMRATKKPIHRREFTFHSDQGAKVMGMTASLLRGDADYNGVAFLFIDLTEVRRLEREAEINRQLAQVGELTAGVVHELRNPLSVISGMSELMMRKLGEENPLYRYAHTIHQETVHLERLIREFLGFARPYDLNITRCDPNSVVQRSIELCHELAVARKVCVESEREEALGLFEGDENRLAQALSNLIRNAVEASQAQGRVMVSVSSDEQRVFFRVEDEGSGLPEESQEDLFRPFTTQKEDGTGLGLSIVHRIVSAHDGAISCGNRAQGGAYFELRIPLERKQLGAY